MPTTHARPASVATGNGIRNGSRPEMPRTLTGTQRLAARNRNRVVGGLLLVVVTALAAAALYSNLGDRVRVLTVAHAVRAGERLTADDFAETLVATDARASTVPADQRDDIVGRVAAVDLAAGSFLAPTQITDDPIGTDGHAVIGATLRPGAFPVGLRRGDAVLVVLMPPEGADGDASATRVVAGTVADVADEPDTGGGVVVSLAVPPGDAASLSIGGARGLLSLVLAPR